MPKSLLLVHGAGSGPWVFDGWSQSFPGVELAAPDLQEGLNVAEASMSNYEERVVAAADLIMRPLALCGWSMGGLVAMMAASKLNPETLVLIEASAPGEVQGFNRDIELCRGLFDSEKAYGAFPPDVRSRTESQYARDERKRGISVPTLPCPTLVISGKDHPEKRGRKLAHFYNAELNEFPELDHWELIRTTAVRDAIRQFLGLGTRADIDLCN